MTLAETGAIGNEASLVDRFRRGDPSAFERIVREHRGPVYRIARRCLPTHEDADEAAQRAFLRAWQGRRGFRGDSTIRTWLVRITLNVARSMRAASRRAEPLDDLERLPDGAEPSDERLRRRELRERVRRAVTALPPRQREAVLLKTFAGMTGRQVARVMGLSEGAVKAHIHQAVKNLRRRMVATAPEERT